MYKFYPEILFSAFIFNLFNTNMNQCSNATFFCKGAPSRIKMTMTSFPASFSENFGRMSRQMRFYE